MWKKTISLVFVLLLSACAANPVAIITSHHADIVISGESRYNAVRLTPEIYHNSNSDLSDMLIKTSSGENVPYFINSGYNRTYSNRETYRMALINSYVKDDYFYFDYELAIERSSDTISTSLQFFTRNTSFAKEVELYGSYDNIHWDYLQKDLLYSIDDKSKLSINFIRPQKYTHYRLKLANNLEKISFHTVNLVYNIETSEETYFIESIVPTFSIENVEKATTITINGLRHLRLCDITIYTDSMFKRHVSTSQGVWKELYNLSFDDTPYADTTIPLNWFKSPNEEYVLSIYNADDKPIEINSITVRYYADELVFEGASGNSYTLEFGEDISKRAPVYDIERYKNDILKGRIDRAVISAVHFVTEEIPPQRDYKALFNIAIVVVTLLLGAVILIKLRKK